MFKGILFTICCCYLLISGCSSKDHSGFKHSSTGIEYQFLETNQGTKPKRGEAIAMNLRLITENGNELKDERYTDDTFIHPITSETALGKRIEPVLLKCHVGDSIVFRIKAAYLFGKTFLPPAVDADDIINCYARVTDVLGYDAYQNEMLKRNKLRAEKRIKDNRATILAYLENENTQAKELDGGIFITITNTGKGKSPQAEDQVAVHYTVYRLDGHRVDASYDRNEPFQFIVGRGGVIDGLDKAVRELKIGGEATVLIPSEKAYGKGSKGKLLPPHSNLRFEIKLMSIDK